jgi:hypothetical protein
LRFRACFSARAQPEPVAVVPDALASLTDRRGLQGDERDLYLGGREPDAIEIVLDVDPHVVVELADGAVPPFVHPQRLRQPSGILPRGAR